MIKPGPLSLGMLAAVALMACGDDDGQQCFPNDHTACIEGSTWWLDSCGNQGALAEACDCGCNADFTGCETCTCQAECTGRVCGDDGCGGTCGSCDLGDTCSTAGQCEPCQADCTNRVCGDDGCGGTCGNCGLGEACNTSGQCEACTADCVGRVCGADGCGGSCGSCNTNETCNAAGQCEGGSTTDLLVFTNCAVPYVLDAALVSDMTYMAGHFGDLVQQYCVTGIVNNNDITVFPEKMYYGQHDSGSTLSFVQLSMNGSLAGEWSVKADFAPDSAVSTSATWPVAVGGLNPNEAYVGLIRHLGASSLCIYAIGTTGQLTFSAAQSVQQVEGGSFTFSGQALMTNPWDLTDYCSQTPANLPCCTR